MNESKVLVVGSANLDTTLRVAKIPVAGETVLAMDRKTTPGGKGANQAVAVCAAGGRASFVGAVGNDVAGDRIMANLRGHDVDVSGVQVIGDEASGLATVVVDEFGENSIVVYPGANARLSPAHVQEEVTISDANVLLFQLEIPLKVAEAAASVFSNGPIILNPAPLSNRRGLGELLAQSDVLVPNQSELGALAELPIPSTLTDVQNCVRSIDFLGAVVVTLGSDGAVLFERPEGDYVHIPAPRVDAIDTSGAGDVFCGTLAHSLSQNASLVEATERAVIVASESTTFAGAQISRRGGF